jgi:glycosyltransferase involved in cell wall biosynthesis
MKISVLIPAYNSAATIRTTLDSVLCQTGPADEILVMDDGSTDETVRILKLYEPRIQTFSQPNSGVSSARNALIARAQGDLIAFIDSDDVWHPRYLELQRKLYERYPQAAAVFVAHENFSGLGPYNWEKTDADGPINVEVLHALSFFRRFQVAPGHFVLSFCCLQKRLFEGIGGEPFKLREAEDVYFFNLLPFWGPIVFATSPLLGAYRHREGSLASNRLNCAAGEVNAFQLMEKHYRNGIDGRLLREFEMALASKRRMYGKILQGAGRSMEARGQLKRSLSDFINPLSIAKSLALLFLTYLPRSLQPRWPPVDRPQNPLYASSTPIESR